MNLNFFVSLMRATIDKISANDFVKTYFNKKIYSVFFVGFSCGLPFLMTLGILDIWLKENGVSNTAIGLFTLCHTPYTVKFLWGPFIDKMKFPFLSDWLGRRRGWAVASQVLLFLGLMGMSCMSPKDSIVSLMLFASIVAFADGCQNIALYAYQINSNTKKEMFGPVAGIVIFGYRIGLFFTKSIALYLAWYCGWGVAYKVIACAVFIGTIFILLSDEPEVFLSKEGLRIEKLISRYKKSSLSKNLFLLNIKLTFFECLIYPFKIFMKKENWKFLITLIMFFKAGDFMMQKMSKPFLLELGYTTLDIANVVQVFGTISVLIGGMFGGYFIRKYGHHRVMFIASIAHACSCLLYVSLSNIGYNIPCLYFIVFIENITGGAMTTSFLAFLYSLCYNGYPATQYALLWAFHEFGGVLMRTFSGLLADFIGWANFFCVASFAFIPGIFLVNKLLRIIDKDTTQRVLVV